MFVDFDKIVVFDLVYSLSDKTITLKNYMRNQKVLEKNYLCLETINLTIFNKEKEELFPHLLELVQNKISNLIINITKKWKRMTLLKVYQSFVLAVF